jgi:hypothetical protein
MTSDDILDYYKEKYNMKERGFAGYRYLAFDEQTPWVISAGMNHYTVNIQDDFSWSWKEEDGRVVDLIWDLPKFNVNICNHEFVEPKLEELHKKYVQFCYELKQAKYKNKLKDIEKDF